MLDYELEHIFSYRARLDNAQVIGPTADGFRAIFLAAEGEVTGTKVRGKMLPGGGDWLTVRTDGVQILDVRGVFETDDGALIYSEYGGVGDLGEDGYQKFLRGELPRTIKLRAAPRYSTTHPKYLWLNRLQCLAVGESEPAKREVRYDVYAVR